MIVKDVSAEAVMDWVRLIEKVTEKEERLTHMESLGLARFLRRVADQLKEEQAIRQGLVRWLELEK